MINYKKIHIWNFPPTLTFVRLNDKYRKEFFRKLVLIVGSQQKLINNINKLSLKYDIKRQHSRLNLYSWINGEKLDRGKTKNINIPLWVLIEFSKIISITNKNDNEVMIEIEKNIEYYTGRGKSNPIIKPKLPIYLTPEMVSVIFHFMGDGHIGKKGISSSYRQMNKKGLNNFLTKLRNIFGEFTFSKQEFNDGRLNIPKIITEFYKYYFNLPSTDTFEAYVPKNIKAMDRDFLIAGLTSFIVDEGYIGDVITIYSGNKTLLKDIREIALKCGYICYNIKEKYAYGKFDVYRFNISSKSFEKYYLDLKRLSYLFPTCSLVQKQERLIKRI